VTPANIDDSQMLSILLDPENQDDYVWADSAYSSQYFEDLLSLGGLESRIHEKDSRNHPLSKAAKERYSVRTLIRAYVQFVFGCMATSMSGRMTIKIGLEMNET
jgi:IS5 family transposase